MLRVARAPGARLPGDGAHHAARRPHACRRSTSGRADEYIDTIAREWLPQLHARGAGRCGRCVLREHRLQRGAGRAAVRGGAARSGCRSRCTPSSSATSAARSWPRATARSRAITWSTQAPRKPRRSARAGTVAVLLPVAFYCLAEARKPPVAALRAAGDRIGHRERLQPRLRPRHLAPAGDEHGDAAVRAHRRGSPARRHAPRGPRARPARAARRARRRTGGGLRGLERALHRGARLLDWLQPASHRGARGRGSAMAESDSLKLGARPLRLADLRRIYAGPVQVQIDAAALGAVRDAHAVTVRLAAGGCPGLRHQHRLRPAGANPHRARAAHAPAAQHHPLAQRRRRPAAR